MRYIPSAGSRGRNSSFFNFVTLVGVLLFPMGVILAAVSSKVLFQRDDYDSMVAELCQLMAGGKTLTVAQVRDHFSTSRKYALALMEHLDAIGVMVREGDERRLR